MREKKCAGTPMLQTLPALFHLQARWASRWPVNTCVLLRVYTHLILMDYVLRSAQKQRAQKNTEIQEEDSRKLGLVRGHVVEAGCVCVCVNIFLNVHFHSSAVLTFSCLQENRVGHDIFNLHCQNVNPEQSRYISLSRRKKREKKTLVFFADQTCGER